MPPTPQPAIVATLTITLKADSSVQISGPIENKMLCYGLLEIARDTVKGYAEAQDKRILTPPPGSAFGKKQ